MIRYFLVFSILSMCKLKSQDFQFVHYPYTPTKVNPAQIGTISKMYVGILHRSQPMPFDMSLKSSMLTASYPLITKTQDHQIGAMGISILDDRSGGMVLYKNQAITLNLASTVRIESRHQLSFGMLGTLHSKTIDLTNATTGSQYSNLIGYDSGLNNGEVAGVLAHRYISLASGVRWQHSELDNSVKTVAGIAMYNMNRSNQGFIKSKSSPFMYVANISRKVWNTDRFSVSPELLFTKAGSLNLMSIGSKFSYLFQSGEAEENSIDLNIRHVLNKSSNASITINRPRYIIGVATEITHYKNISSPGPAIEILLALKAQPYIFNRVKDKKERAQIAKELKAKKEEERRNEAEKKQKKAKRKKAKSRKNKIEEETASPKTEPQKNVVLPVDKEASEPTAIKATTDSTVTELNTDTLETSISTASSSHETEEQAPNKWETRVFAEQMLKNLEFEFKSTDLTASSKKHLEQFAILLNAMPTQKIKIVGHSDNLGSDKGNLAISEQRAMAVKSYLVSMGIDPSRITTEGQGANSPLYPNNSEQGRAKNRRVEFYFSSEE